MHDDAAGTRHQGGLDFSTLPEPLRYGLLLGGSGRPHLARLASLALSAPATVGLGLDLLLAAWEASPLDGGLAASLLGLDARAGFLSQGVRRAVAACAAGWRQPGEADLVAALAAGRRHGELATLLADAFRREPDNLFWRGKLLELSALLGDWDAASPALLRPWPAGLEAAANLWAGDVAFQQGRLEEARRHYAGARLLRAARMRLARVLFGLGLHREAGEELRKAAVQAPWNVDALLRLYDRVAGLDLPTGSLSGSLCLCLYTCGKADLVDDTLEAVFASDLGDARVLVLDNGAPRDTAGMLDAWKERSSGAMEVIGLPVNVGAPAARNWLMAHPWAAGSDFVAYLDDDALLPPGWRAHLATAVSAYPHAGVWGCKVVDLAHPGRVQSAETNLLEEEGDLPGFSSLCTQDLDYGQWDRVRPCTSVTGCFHAFRTATLNTSGGFDIRFSPTQYDDLDHDLRLAARGVFPVCQGHLTVRHARLSGALLNQDVLATANSTANLGKLAAKHGADERASIRSQAARVLERDLAGKQILLAREGLLGQ